MEGTREVQRIIYFINILSSYNCFLPTQCMSFLFEMGQSVYGISGQEVGGRW